MLPAGTLAPELDPILITAPTIRCGTTLLQRLLGSSADAMIFGEQAADELVTALFMAHMKTTLYANDRANFAASLAAFTAGDRNDWMFDLLPDVDGFLGALIDGYLAPLAYCRDFARRAGRPRWGVKFPGWGQDVLQLIAASLPLAKLIVIRRDIVAVLRSAKARKSIRRPSEVNTLCEQWANNTRFVMQWPLSESVLLLDYEELERDPEPVLRRIEAFTGVAGIERGVLEHRINAPEYIVPVELSDAELRAAEAAQRRAREALG